MSVDETEGGGAGVGAAESVQMGERAEDVER